MARDSAVASNNLPDNEYSAAGVLNKQSSRKQKSLRFRARRRELKKKLYGHEFGTRETIKNPMRQIAAKNRKRDGTGKFLDGPRAVRNTI